MIHTAVKHFKDMLKCDGAGNDPEKILGTRPHLIVSCIEHDSIRLPVEHLVKEWEAGEF